MLDALGYGAPAIIAWVLIVLHFIAGFVVVNTPLMLQLEEWAGVPRPFSAKMKGSQQQQSGKDIEGDGKGDASNDNVPITSDDLNLAAEKAMSLTVEDTVCASLTWKQRMISIAIRVAVICFEGTSLSIYLSIYLSISLSIYLCLYHFVTRFSYSYTPSPNPHPTFTHTQLCSLRWYPHSVVWNAPRPLRSARPPRFVFLHPLPHVPEEVLGADLSVGKGLPHLPHYHQHVLLHYRALHLDQRHRRQRRLVHALLGSFREIKHRCVYFSRLSACSTHNFSFLSDPPGPRPRRSHTRKEQHKNSISLKQKRSCSSPVIMLT